MITISNINPMLDKHIDMHTDKRFGVTASVHVHEIARRLDAYHLPIDCWQIGKDKAGNEIAINCLGRFLFGVPGYDGHLRIVADGQTISIHYPSEPAEAETLMQQIKVKIEEENDNE